VVQAHSATLEVGHARERGRIALLDPPELDRRGARPRERDGRVEPALERAVAMLRALAQAWKDATEDPADDSAAP
jgi:hypothetical protein